MVIAERSAELALSAYVDSILGFDGRSNAPATDKALAVHWRAFARWTERLGLNPESANPDTIAAFLASEAENGKSLSTIKARAWALKNHFGGQDNPENPAAGHRVKEVLRRINRLMAEQKQRQATPLDSEALTAIRDTACKPRRMGRGLEKPEKARRRGLQDIALAYILSDGGLRRSEVAALTWADLSEGDDGIGLLYIAKSKTDQSGEGAVVGLTPEGYQAVMTYRRECRPNAVYFESMFHLNGHSISNRVKAMTKAAGLEGDYSGHSGRVGMAVRAARSGLSVTETMNQGRWKQLTMLARYQQPVKANEFARRLR